MTIDDIKIWAVSMGIGHVVTSINGEWVTTACHHWMTGTAVPDRPKRICRKCRAAIPALIPAGGQK